MGGVNIDLIWKWHGVLWFLDERRYCREMIDAHALERGLVNSGTLSPPAVNILILALMLWIVAITWQQMFACNSDSTRQNNLHDHYSGDIHKYPTCSSVCKFNAIISGISCSYTNRVYVGYLTTKDLTLITTEVPHTRNNRRTLI